MSEVEETSRHYADLVDWALMTHNVALPLEIDALREVFVPSRVRTSGRHCTGQMVGFYFTGSVRKRSFEDFSAGSSITATEVCCPFNNCRNVSIPLVTSSANFGAT